MIEKEAGLVENAMSPDGSVDDGRRGAVLGRCGKGAHGV